MSLILLAMPLLFQGFQGFQDSDTSELRFYRVHLKNGNFIDGELVKDSPNEVHLRLKVGEMTIRRDQIDKVEFVKMKSTSSGPLYRADPNKLPPKEPPKDPVPGKESRNPIIDKINPEVRKKVDVMVWKVRTTPGGEKSFPLDQLSALGDEAAIYLAARIPDVDAGMHGIISSALINLKNAKTIPVLESLLSHEAGSVRAVAVTVLAMLVDTEAERAKFIRPLVKDRDESVRGTVMGLLNNAEDVEWFDAVIDLCTDANKDIRNKALNIVNRLAQKHNLQEKYSRILTQNLRDRDDGVRADTAMAVGSTGKPENWRLVAPLLNDAEPKVRSAAAESLIKLGSEEAGPDIVNRVPQERDRLVRIFLAGAVQKFRLSKAVEPLIDWLLDPDEDVKKVTAETLKMLTGEQHGTDREKWAAWFAAQKK